MIVARRRTLARSLLATLFVSQGVPMLEMGDELWRTQRGQQQRVLPRLRADVGGLAALARAASMSAAATALASLRKRLAVLQQRDFLKGAQLPDGRKRHRLACGPTAREMQIADWREPVEGDDRVLPRGGASVLVLMNGEPSP